MNINKISNTVYPFEALKQNTDFNVLKQFSQDCFDYSKKIQTNSFFDKLKSFVFYFLGLNSWEPFDNFEMTKKIRRNIKLLNRETNNYEEACVIQKNLGLFSINADNKELGSILLAPAGTSCKEELLKNAPAEYKNKNFLEIIRIETINNGNNLNGYKGIGRELIKQAVIESQKIGFEGRIALKSLNFKKNTPSPDGFYKHIGLYKSGTENSYTLYTLPEENIKNFLCDT